MHFFNHDNNENKRPYLLGMSETSATELGALIQKSGSNEMKKDLKDFIEAMYEFEMHRKSGEFAYLMQKAAKEFDGETLQVAMKMVTDGLDINSNSSMGTALHHAVQILKGDPNVYRTLITHGADPFILNHREENVLTYAAARGNIDAFVEICALCKLDINHKISTGSRIGDTHLHYAARFYQPEAWSRLAECGLDRSITNADGRTDWDVAIACNNSVLCMAMLDLPGTDVRRPDPVTGRTVMHAVVASERVRLFREMQVLGADVNAQDLKGNTPLHAVCTLSSDRRLSMFSELLSLGANPMIQNNDGQAVLGILNKNKSANKDVIKLLNATMTPLKARQVIPKPKAAASPKL